MPAPDRPVERIGIRTLALAQRAVGELADELRQSVARFSKLVDYLDWWG